MANFKHVIKDVLGRQCRFYAQPDIQRPLTLMRNGIGRIEERQLASYNSPDIKGAEFQVYSQWGEDGIIQYLLRHVEVPNRQFIEFGVENYMEANTRWLVEAHDWSGLVIDGSEEHVRFIREGEIYWKHQLRAVQAFVTRENIDQIIQDNGPIGEIGILSVDIDGMDYWIWEKISVVYPSIVIVEYNSLFGPERSVTVPYDGGFIRHKVHYSGIYYGASLKAFVQLGRRKGFAFVGSNSAGNNAFFVRSDLVRPPLRDLTAAEGYVKRNFRESRNENGDLAFSTLEQESALISHLPLVEVE
jgi:hypothetical protein